jgi:hypothetical protein
MTTHRATRTALAGRPLRSPLAVHDDAASGIDPEAPDVGAAVIFCP